MTRGYDRPLYVLPFDHRGSFETGMFGWKGTLTPEQTALANRIAQGIHRLPPETVAALHAILDATAPQPKPRLRRAAGQHR